MSEYKVFQMGKGLRYQRDKKFISKKDIPANIFSQLEPGKVVSDEGVKLEGNLKECLFCGVPCKLTRTVNLQIVNLCDTHYYSKNIGQIAAELRSQDGSTQTETTEEG